MADDPAPRARYGEAFWRAHHEAWTRSDLNQRQYCEAQGISLKAFGNWRAKFKAEPQLPARELLYRRGGASHSLGHTPSHALGHSFSHAAYPSFAPSPGPIVSPAGRAIGDGSARLPGAISWPRRPSPAPAYPRSRGAMASARRVLCRWRQEETAAATPSFVEVEIIDGLGAPEDVAP